jgi:hypothetical protein
MVGSSSKRVESCDRENEGNEDVFVIVLFNVMFEVSNSWIVVLKRLESLKDLDEESSNLDAYLLVDLLTAGDPDNKDVKVLVSPVNENEFMLGKGYPKTPIQESAA